MSETQSQEKVTVAIASKVLNVDRRTIYRWMDKGLLSKVKEGNNTYVLMDDVRALRDKAMSHDKKGNVAENRGNSEAVSDIVTIERTHYEGLLTRLGQLEAKQELLLEYKGGLEAKDKELAEARTTITKARSELQRLLEVKQDAEAKRKALLEQQATLEAKERENIELKAEVERLKRPWWKKIFQR